MSAGPVDGWELDRLAREFPAWSVRREGSGRLVAEKDGVRLEGPSEAVLRCHLSNADFPVLRPR